jgi:hypothetical protein
MDRQWRIDDAAGFTSTGKWLAQALTGTQRYATEIVQAIVSADCFDLVIHVPADAEVPVWAHRHRVEIRRAPINGVVFEQLYLSFATAGRLLLNFAGPAPLLKRRQLVAMHDATPFRYPETFRWAFVAFYFVMYLLLGRTAIAACHRFTVQRQRAGRGIAHPR